MHRTLVAMILAWVPTAVLAASGGLASLKWFAIDVAAQSRFFIVIPLLIVSEPVLVEWLEAIALHFVSENMIRKEDMPRFEAAFDFFKRNKNSYLAHIVLVGVAYAILASSMHLIHARTLLPWCYANNSEANLSLA
ncbi:MAG TPA: hypothetical protein VFX22_08590, partial [Candidatus Kapabacteria bacterium]|nr:hypothetical protein [Candidatus Kapabacteria bacterium]